MGFFDGLLKALDETSKFIDAIDQASTAVKQVSQNSPKAKQTRKAFWKKNDDELKRISENSQDTTERNIAGEILGKRQELFYAAFSKASFLEESDLKRIIDRKSSTLTEKAAASQVLSAKNSA